MAHSVLLHLLTTGFGTSRTSGDVGFRAAVRGIADIQHARSEPPRFMRTRLNLAPCPLEVDTHWRQRGRSAPSHSLGHHHASAALSLLPIGRPTRFELGEDGELGWPGRSAHAACHRRRDDRIGCASLRYVSAFVASAGIPSAPLLPLIVDLFSTTLREARVTPNGS